MADPRISNRRHRHGNFVAADEIGKTFLMAWPPILRLWAFGIDAVFMKFLGTDHRWSWGTIRLLNLCSALLGLVHKTKPEEKYKY